MFSARISSTAWPGELTINAAGPTNGTASEDSGLERLLKLKVVVSGGPVGVTLARHGDPGFPWIFWSVVALAGLGTWFMIRGVIR